MLIVGAGMAGLLAGHMLRRYSPRIIEAQPKLPNNHSALLRFRSNAVSEATGIPFKKVRVRKAMGADEFIWNEVTIADSNQYSQKVTGEVMDRSVLNLEPVDRWIAPENFIAQLAEGLDIQYGELLTREWIEEREFPEDFPIISTIPMPELMKMVGWEAKGDPFIWRPIWTVTTQIKQPRVLVYQTIYYPSLVSPPYYRASLAANRLSIEYSKEPHAGAEIDQHIINVLTDFGIYLPSFEAPTLRRQEYGKLISADELARRTFIMAMTDRYNLWSLGRFATWRQLLLDDVVKDVRFIDTILSTRDQYSRRLHHAEKAHEVHTGAT